MADISQYLQDILDAVYGEDVRNSIHDAIEIINDVSEVVLSTGTAVTSASSSSTGFYTDSLYLNTNTYELWKCIGTDSWQSLGILKGDAGSPGQDGDDGNKWYRSSNISGKSPNPTVYSGSGITEANAGDLNLNVSEGAVYHCVTGGDASTATWSYDFTMTGGGGSGDTVSWNQIQASTGSTKIAEISINGFSTDVYAPSGGGGGLSNAFDEVSVGGTTIAASGGDTLTLSAGSNITLTPNSGTKTVEIAASGGGHTMIDNTDLINEMETAITEGVTNDDVVSAYGVGTWSNCDDIQLLVAVSADDDGIGTWEDDDTWETSGVRTGWIQHASLHGIMSDDDVMVEPVFKVPSGSNNAVSAYAMRVDDAITSSLGGVAIKFNAPITANGYAGVRVRHLRTNTIILTP